MISDAVLEEIKYRNQIEDVVSSYVTLKRSGANLTGLCPFHSEKTPSFTVYASSKSFFCFGCGAGGNVITFIMRIENLDYVSALEYLAKRANIPLPKDSEREDSGVKRSRLYDMNRDAAKFFNAKLMENEAPLKYLADRGTPKALIRHFGLGYSPDIYGSLANHMKALGYGIKELEAGFLCGVSKKTDKPFDYFRGRIMFPIIDVTGNVIAFGGRVFQKEKDGAPKYLNSSDTPVFKKSRNLFALNFAKNHCAESLILCEGYMDVIALHGAGFQNSAATLGTSITPDHARMIGRYTKSVIIAYDSDAAGQKAADKAFRLLGEVGIETRILRLPDSKDPDEFLNKTPNGAILFKNLLEKSATQFDYKMNIVTNKYNMDVTEDKIKGLHELIAVISEINSEIERDIYIKRCSEQYSVNSESIKNEVNKIIRKRIKDIKKDEKESLFRTSAGYGDRVNPDKLTDKKSAAAEETILGIILTMPEYLKSLLENDDALKAEDFKTAFNRRVFEEIVRIYENNKIFDEVYLADVFNFEQISRITKYKIGRNGLTNNKEILSECIKTLKSDDKKNEIWRKLNERRKEN